VPADLIGPPNGDFDLNQNNFCVLRAVVEAITGQDYVPYVNSHVFVPFGRCVQRVLERDPVSSPRATPEEGEAAMTFE